MEVEQGQGDVTKSNRHYRSRKNIPFQLRKSDYSRALSKTLFLPRIDTLIAEEHFPVLQ